MRNIDFDKYLVQAMCLCEDYSTHTTDDEIESVDMIWFTPAQLKKYTEYCLEIRRKNKANQSKTEVK